MSSIYSSGGANGVINRSAAADALAQDLAFLDNEIKILRSSLNRAMVRQEAQQKYEAATLAEMRSDIERITESRNKLAGAISEIP